MCLGNICRSPYAAEALRERLPPSLDRRIEVESAGLLYEEGRRSPPEAVDVAARRGIELRPHRSAIVGPVRGPTRPLVFVMDPGQRARLLRRPGHRPERIFVLGDLDPQPVRRRTVRDPFGHGEEVFEEVYARLDRCVEEVSRLIAETDGG